MSRRSVGLAGSRTIAVAVAVAAAHACMTSRDRWASDALAIARLLRVRRLAE
ncbi:hypothetical protein BURMUCF2_B0572 [Burkholderia multivorans CF2]|nr:hypothetical protein BURMUCF2_B0572 [Burkholderia multivorans CF2]